MVRELTHGEEDLTMAVFPVARRRWPAGAQG